MIDEYRISDRQRQIVEFAALGLTDKEIAHRLGLSEGTLRTYWDRLRKRLDAQSRTEVLARLNQQRYDRLEETHKDLEAIIRQLPQFVWTANPSGYVEYCNDWFSRFSGRPVTDFIGEGCRALMSEEDQPQSAERWCRAQATGQPYEAQVRFRCSLDGTERWHRIRLVPLANDRGEIVRWLGTAHELFPQSNS